MRVIKLSTKFKFILSYVLVSLIMLILLNTYGQHTIYTKLVQHEQTKLYEEAELIAKDYVPSMSILDTTDSTLRKHFSSLQTLTNMRVWIVASSGNILMDSNVSNSCSGENINQYDPAFLANQTIVGIKPKGLLTESMITVVYPITESLDTSGYIVLMSPSSELNQKATNYIDSIIICYFIMLILAGIIFIYLYYQTELPLRSMTKAAKEYADGHFDYPMVQPSGHDQMELASAIRYLADRMSNLTEYQKNFVANVSHDFRSPLTSIKGYTEAIADGTIPPEMQEKYFNIILFEIERLTKLTGNLLELSQLEHDGLSLELADFDINLAIKKTSASFEQRCVAKKISIDLIFSEKQLYVRADINKIQQVIQNLLDNAVKFSPNDSVIEIHTAEQNHKVFVSVKDHGIGIPRSSLQKVWSRFYKTDISRGKDKTGTGLGLSITKEILEAHEENINVISTEGVGTEFIFSLPKGNAESIS